MDYRNHDTDVSRRVSLVTSAALPATASGNPAIAAGQGEGFRYNARGASGAAARGMTARDARVNRLCVALLDRMELVGWWTLEGPSPVALMASVAGARKTALPFRQWTALQLAFAAWRMPVIHARGDYWPISVADLLKLDRRAMRHVSAFMRGLARLGGAL